MEGHIQKTIATMQKGEAMSDYISREAAIDAVDELSAHYTNRGREWHPHVDHIMDELKRLPSADVRENVCGKWKKDSQPWKDGYGGYHCSACLAWWEGPDYDIPNFCPDCGARMILTSEFKLKRRKFLIELETDSEDEIEEIEKDIKTELNCCTNSFDLDSMIIKEMWRQYES